MAKLAESVSEETLLALIEGRGVSEFMVGRSQDGEGYVISVRYTSATRWLPVRSRREPVRLWRSLSAAGVYLERIGVRSFVVEL